MIKQKRLFIFTVVLLLSLIWGCQPNPNQTVIVAPTDIINGSKVPVTDGHIKIQSPTTMIEEVSPVSTKDLRIAFDAEVVLPEVSSYSIGEASPHNFSDKKVIKMFNILRPDTELISEPTYTKDQWMAMIDWYSLQASPSLEKEERLSKLMDELAVAPVIASDIAFSFDGISQGHQYTAYFTNEEGLYGYVYATKGGNDFCFLRDMELSCYRKDILLPYEDAELLKDYEGEFPISQEDALKTALQVLDDLELSEMQLINAEKMCTYKFGQLVSKGWDFIFTHGVDGLPAIFDFASVSYGGEGLPLPTLCSPWGQEAALISVDENGVICVDLRNIAACDDVLIKHVELLPLEKIKTNIANHLLQVYRYPAQNIENSEIIITRLQLCASLINAKDNYYSGLLIPSWLVSFEYRGDSSKSYTDETGVYHAADTFINKESRYFSAIDGSYIEPRITKDMLEWG